MIIQQLDPNRLLGTDNLPFEIHLNKTCHKIAPAITNRNKTKESRCAQLSVYSFSSGHGPSGPSPKKLMANNERLPVFLLACRRPFDQFFDRPYVVTQPAGHRWRRALQRLMLPGEIIPRHEHPRRRRATSPPTTLANRATPPPQSSFQLFSLGQISADYCSQYFLVRNARAIQFNT